VVLREMNYRNDDIVFTQPIGGQAGGQRIDVAEDAFDDVRPRLRAADFDELRDANPLAGPERLEFRQHLGRDWPRRVRELAESLPRGGGSLGWGGIHSGPPFMRPRTRAMRPVRASSRMPNGRIRSMNASIFCSCPEISIIKLS